ncbi:MAG: type 4a pilus biogenesis protein PilO [Candidatus Omnitrophica bacterium]|jgi:Tfp pilus assembly protein PilO|nr:type 4a pilus biogenesis protein PilO [Candidatus Omnitrophota bacterium]
MTKINELIKNPRVKIAGIALLIILLSLIFLKFSGALWAKNNSLKEQIKKAGEEINRAAKISSTQETLDSEVQKLNEQIALAQDNFFQNVEDIFSSLNHFAQETKLSMQSINPEERTRTEVPNRNDMYLEILPLTLKLNCDFRQLLAFLGLIEKSKKNISVTSINIQNNPQDIWNHRIDIELKTPLLIYAKTNE